MIANVHRFLIKTIPGVLMALFIYSLQAAVAGTFMNLEPGVSTKADVERVLGKPTRAALEGKRYDYDKKETQTRRISVTYYPRTMVVERIDIYPLDSNTKAQYKSWLGLKAPNEKTRDTNLNIVEYYATEGIALHCDGPDDTAVVLFFTHFDPAAEIPKIYPPKIVPKAENRSKNETFYIEASDKALEKENWPRAKTLIMEGLRTYPNNAELWHSRASYYVKCKSEPLEKRRSEAMSAMYRAYILDPSAKFAGEMAWLHHKIKGDCTLALSYYEEAEQKGLGRKEPGLYYWMGTCYEKIGMFTSAKTYYQRFVNDAEGHEKQSEARIAMDRLKNY